MFVSGGSSHNHVLCDCLMLPNDKQSTPEKSCAVLKKVAHLSTAKASEQPEERENWRTVLVAGWWLVHLGFSTLQQTAGIQISIKHPVVLELNVTSLVHIKPCLHKENHSYEEIFSTIP